MLQTNLIFGIQKKIKEGHNVSIHLDRSGITELTESGVGQETPAAKKEILLENFYNPGIISGIYQQTSASKKKKEHKKTLIMESFHLTKAERKLTKDINYFNYLFENFVDDAQQEDYQMLLESIFEDTIRLYQECDVTPRVISPAIDSNELTENQIVDLYKNSLNQTVKNQYTKPLLSGKISELYENEIRTLTKKLLEEGVSADIDQVRIYLPFEETVYRFNREVLIPKTAESRIHSFMESMTSDYTDLLEETAADIMKSIEQKIKLLTSMVSPNMFEKAVDASGVNAPKMAGISIAVDKNFNDEEDCSGDICPAEAALDDEAAAEMEAEAEAIDLDSESEDIVGAEEDAKDNLGQASSSEDLETIDAENAAELSAAEAAGENDQPGAIEKDLPSESAPLGKDGYSDNGSDVSLQGKGYDNGEDAQSSGATLPGSPVPGSTTDVSSDINTGEEEGGSSNDTSGANIPGSAKSSSGTPTNDSDESISKPIKSSGNTETSGSSLPGKSKSNGLGEVNKGDESLSGGASSPTGNVSVGVVGADGDDSNHGLGAEIVDKEDDEVNTDTPSETEMNSKESLSDNSIIPRL